MNWSKSEFLTIFCLIIQASFCAELPENYNYDECAPDKEVCEYWLSVKEKLTMIYGKDLVYAHEGKLYRYDDHNATTAIPNENVVTVDGEPRMVIAVNETVPGPPIVVYEGQSLTIHVKNYLLSDSLTIHWHGLHQKGTPFMDGVGYISQCPIAAGQSFTYQFKAKPKGTFWYHSHVGAQRTNGVFGAFIIKEKPRKNFNPPTDVIMQVGDWHHHSSEEVYVKMVYGNFIGRTPYKTTSTQDGGKFSGVPWVSGLIEGKGRYFNQQTGKLTEAPITWYKVEKGKTYRFRVINVGTIFPFRVSIDEHDLTVVASDGYDMRPRKVESLVINPGERFDFLLEANHTVNNYWLRANSMEADVENHTVEAVLHYFGASNESEPETLRRPCTKDNPCDVMNCPFSYYPKDEYTNCILLSEMKNADSEDSPPIYAEDSEEHFLNFAFPGLPGITPGAVNGRKFEFPGVNSLTQSNEIGDYDCNKHTCGVDKVCYCHYELSIPFNKTIQMVWLNMGAGAGWGHPIHLHGHSFYILKMGYAPQNSTSGKLLEHPRNHSLAPRLTQFIDNEDIYCGGSLNYCNAATWRNTSWKGDNIPGLNLKNPPRKDTLIIPTGGYAVLRIRSDNPGKWFMHCHIEVHALDGMAMVLKEAMENVPKPPKGFPVCKNFYNDHSRDVAYSKINEEILRKELCESNQRYLISIGILAGIVLLLTILVVVLLCKQRKSSFKMSSEQQSKPNASFDMK